MPRIRLATRSSLVALYLAAFVGFSGFAEAQPAAPPAQSTRDDSAGIPGKGQARLDRREIQAKAQDQPARQKPEPGAILPAFTWGGGSRTS